MSLGTWCLTIYSLPLTVLTAMAWLPAGGLIDWIRFAAVIAGLLPAFGSAVYKGVLFSTTAQPGWKDARWLGAYHTTSAFLLGAGGLMVMSLFMGQERAAAVADLALILLLILNAAALGLVVFDLRSTLTRVYNRQELRRLGALVLGGSVLAPLGLLIAGGQVGPVAMIVLAALVIRIEIVRIPHATDHR